jgi:hypothetical protein
VDGSSKIPDELMESLEPFDTSEAVPFETAYLAGYLADRYDVTAKECVDKANHRIKRTTEDALGQSITGAYATMIPQGSWVNLENGIAKYALYPVWILNTKWKGQQYTFAMNGQTGKFVGNLPVDKGAYWRYHGMWTAIFALISFIVIMATGII